MGKNIKLGDIFQLGDILALLVIVAGVLIAIFLEGLAVKLIGVSVAVLGGLAIIMLISQRLSDMVESNKFNLQNQPNFTMTIVKDASAKRQTIEDFNISFGNQDDLLDIQNTMGADEGFRIVSKSTRSTNVPKPIDPVDTTPSVAHNPDNNVTESELQNETVDLDSIASNSLDLSNDKQISVETVNNLASEDISQSDIKQNIEFETIPEKPKKNDYSDVINQDKSEMTITNSEKEINHIVEIYDNIEDKDLEISEETIDNETQTQQIFGDNTHIEPLQTDIHTNINEEIPQSSIEVNTPVAIDEDKPLPSKEESAKDEVKPNYTKPHTEPKDKYKKNTFDTPISLLTDDEPNISKEPRKEFENYISRILIVIRSVINTKTASLILTNSERNQLILESYVTSVPDAITNKDRIPLAKDIVSQILNSGKPEILTEINPSAELDLIPYYSISTGVSSFIGLPVFYQKEAIGVLCCDTNEMNAYNASTVSFLSHFSRLISNLMINYSEKYDLLHAEQALLAINNFNQLSSTHGIDSIGVGKAITEAVSIMYDIQNIGVCLFDDNRNNWHILDYRSFNEAPSYIKHKSIDLGNTLIGDCIISSQTIVEVPIESKKTRVFADEMPLSGGYFVAIPIKSEHNTYGAFYLEGASYSGVHSFNLNILETIARSAGVSVERVNLIKMLQNGSIIDPETGLMNSTAFFKRLQEEISKTNHIQSLATLLFVSIDKYSAYEESERNDQFERINHFVIDLLNKNLNDFDVLGRVELGIFGVVLIGQGSDKAKIWAERIRNSSAISVIEFEHKRFTVTLSIGIAEICKGDDLHSLTSNANKALNIAANRTNSVQVYQ